MHQDRGERLGAARLATPDLVERSAGNADTCGSRMSQDVVELVRIDALPIGGIRQLFNARGMHGRSLSAEHTKFLIPTVSPLLRWSRLSLPHLDQYAVLHEHKHGSRSSRNALVIRFRQKRPHALQDVGISKQRLREQVSSTQPPSPADQHEAVQCLLQ